MWKNNDFDTIFTSNDVMNIKDKIWKWFGYGEIEYSMGVNAYFGPIRTNIPHEKSNYGTGKSNS